MFRRWEWILMCCLVMAIGFLFTVTELHAADNSIQARKVLSPPVIDGKLSDAAWRLASKVTGFVTSTGKPTPFQTTAYLCYDDENLYIAFKCDEPQIRNMKATSISEKHFCFTKNDLVAFLFKPDAASPVFYQFAVTSKGVKFDQENKGRGTQEYNPDWQAATSIGKDYWIVETALPLEAVNAGPQMGTTWRINFCRMRFANREYSSWQNVLGGWKNVDRFGYLKGMIIGGEQLVKSSPFVLRDISPGETAIGRNVLSVRVKNKARTDGKLKIEAEVTSPAGIKSNYSTLADIGARKEKSVHIAYDLLPQQGNHILSLTFLDATTSKPLYKSPAGVIYIPSFLDTYLNRTYYTHEKEARINVEVDLSSEPLKGLSITSELKDKDRLIAAKKTSGPISTHTRFTFSLKDLENANYTVTTRLLDAQGYALATNEDTLTKLPPAADEVKVDKEKRIILVNDKPFLIRGIWQVRVEDYEKVKEAGFNTVVYAGTYSRQINAVTTEEDHFRPDTDGVKMILKRAAEVGLRAMPKMTTLDTDHPRRFDKFKARIPDMKTAVKEIGQFALQHPALLGYRVYDEPYNRGDTPEICTIFHDIVKEVSPYHLPILFFSRSMRFDISGKSELMGLWGYNYLTAGVNVSTRLASLEPPSKLARKLHLPFIYGFQADLVSGSRRNITPREQRCLTYLNLISDATGGITWFAYSNRIHPDVWEELKKLNGEIDQLSPVLLTESAPLKVSTYGTVSPVRLSIKEYNKRLYLISVNTSMRAVDADLTLASIAPSSRVKVLFEDRSIKAEGDSFSDRFRGFGTHVYELIPTDKKKDKSYEIVLSTTELEEVYDPEVYYARKTRAIYKDEMIFIDGRDNTLSSVAADINDPEVFFYDPVTRTVELEYSIHICYGARLTIGDKNDPTKQETLKMVRFFDLLYGDLEMYNSTLVRMGTTGRSGKIRTRFDKPRVTIRNCKFVNYTELPFVRSHTDEKIFDVQGAELVPGENP